MPWLVECRGWSSPRSERRGALSEEKWLASLKSPDWEGCLLLHNARATHADRCFSVESFANSSFLHRWPRRTAFTLWWEQARGNKQPHGGSREGTAVQGGRSGARKTREAATRLPIARMRMAAGGGRWLLKGRAIAVWLAQHAPYSTAARNILEAGEVGQAFFHSLLC